MRIALNAGGLGGMTISGFQSDAASLTSKIDGLIVTFVAVKSKTCNLNGGVGRLGGALDSIQARINTETARKDAAIAAQTKVNSFLALAIRVDNQVATVVLKNKEEFYKVNPWLRPASEKPWWEKLGDGWNDFWDGAGDFLKKAWDGLMDFCKSSLGKIILGVLVIAALALVVFLTGGAAAGILGAILAGALKGAIIGALTGAAIGAATAAIEHRLSTGSWDGVGKAMFDGAANGFLTGALTGALFGGLGGAGQVFGKGINCLSTVGKVISVTSKTSGVISLAMGGFDLLSFGAGLLFGKDNFITAFNTKLHSNNFYNAFQIGVSALAVFSAGAASTMKCFVAGTMILTAAGLVAIENIKAGDKVISTNSDTFETDEKTVLETYIRETTVLVHLTINGESIRSTRDHPFYVKDLGFVNAGELRVGSELIDSDGKSLFVEGIRVKLEENPVTVYNFQVEDFHTYHVGDIGVLVHNATYDEKVAQLSANKKQGDDFEKQTKPELQKTQSDVVEQITVKTESGTKTRLDFVGKEGDTIRLTEAKSSATAPLTGKQEMAFPEIAESGATVVGAGKPPFTGGTKIPPTKVDIVRPK